MEGEIKEEVSLCRFLAAQNIEISWGEGGGGGWGIL